jgi:hypothetical protein
MSTRSCVAVIEGDSWRGVYCHSDGYPTARGKEVWDAIHALGGDVEAFKKKYIDAHKSGWSSFGTRCYCHPKRAKDALSLRMGWATREAETNDNRIAEADVTSGKWWDIEYVYILAPGVLTIGTVGHNDWQPIAQVRLDDPEPDWAAIEQREEALA